MIFTVFSVRLEVGLSDAHLLGASWDYAITKSALRFVSLGQHKAVKERILEGVLACGLILLSNWSLLLFFDIY